MLETTPEPLGIYFAWDSQNHPPLWDIAQAVREHPDWKLFRLIEDENDWDQIALAPSLEYAELIRVYSIATVPPVDRLPMTDQPW